jgi:predicted RNase H-like nuclease (RuvC/YqgF family)
MPSASYIAKNVILAVKKDVLPPIVKSLQQKNKELEDKLEKQSEMIELLKEQIAALTQTTPPDSLKKDQIPDHP